jgi:hypothetical protein
VRHQQCGQPRDDARMVRTGRRHANRNPINEVPAMIALVVGNPLLELDNGDPARFRRR